MQKRIIKTIRYFIPLAVVISGMSGLVSLSIQQNFRQNANDPQIQMAENAANSLDSGIAPQALISLDKVDMAKSLSPFIIIFDQHGKVIASNAFLNGSTPTPPSGVFDFIKSNGANDTGQINDKLISVGVSGSIEDRFTWEPASGVRDAAVVTKYNSGYVLAGRSLFEVENREDNLTQEVFLAWLATMGATLFTTFLFV